MAVNTTVVPGTLADVAVTVDVAAVLASFHVPAFARPEASVVSVNTVMVPLPLIEKTTTAFAMAEPSARPTRTVGLATMLPASAVCVTALCASRSGGLGGPLESRQDEAPTASVRQKSQGVLE